MAGLAPQQPITAASPAAATAPMATGSAATADRHQISARLPASDWQIRWRRQPDGRTVLEVTDQAGNLTGLAASTRLPITSVDGAWRSADGSQQPGCQVHRSAHPVTARTNQSALTAPGPGRPVNGVRPGPLGCPPMMLIDPLLGVLVSVRMLVLGR
jgi:hypothetical protein